MKKHAIIPIFISHRGCPNQCVFCNQRAITTRSGDVTVLDAKKTIDEWLTTLDRNNTEIEISFFGGSFTGIPIEQQTEFLKLAKEYKDKGLIHKIHCSTRPDYINKDILDNLKKYDLDIIELGVQSFDQKVLDASKRGHDTLVVEQACKLIHEYGFTLGIQLMIGLPGDSYESCMYSVQKAIEMKPSIARLYPTVVITDTPLEKMMESGEYIPPSQDEIIRRTNDMNKALESAGIKVIRIGLKSNELIKGETYHPAIGQIVKSKAALDDILNQIEKLKDEITDIEDEVFDNGYHKRIKTDITVFAPTSLFNFAVGYEASNKKYLELNFPKLRVHFKEDNSFEGILVQKGKY